MLIDLKSVFLEYNDKCLLNNISLSIKSKDKIGLIGQNGVGKSSLLKTIANFDKLSDVNVMYKNGLTSAYLLQDTYEFNSNDAISYVCENNKELEFEAKKILNKLDVDFTQDIDKLSGGQKKRLALAKVLLKPVDLLLLDEPTNHLDVEMIMWLENYLKKINCAIVMVTHDRYFLERVTNKIIELDNGAIYEYIANYSSYLSIKAKRLEDESSTKRKQLTMLKNEEKWMMQGAKARSTKSKDRIERYHDLKDSLVENKQEDLQLLVSTQRIGKKILEIDNVSIGYQDNILIKDFSYTFKKNDCVGVVGKNGSGKSSLLNTLAKKLNVIKGKLDYGTTIKIGYYKQSSSDLNDNDKVIDYIKNKAEFIKTKDGLISASSMLERFLFSSEKQYTLIGKLSGGEKRRLLLLGVLMNNPNFLILDEPTNDLDLDTLAILEDYLSNFNGVVIIVSHDRFFMDRLTNLLWIIEDQKIELTNNDYSSYLNQQKSTNKTVNKDSKKEYSKTKKIRLSYQEQKELETIDDDIIKLENELSKINNKMNNCMSDYDSLKKLELIQQELELELETKNNRWIELYEKIELINKQTNN